MVYMILRFLCLIIGFLLLQKSALPVGQTAVLAFLAKKAFYMLVVSDSVSNQQGIYFDSFVASYSISFVN